jgi:hypothetical protein
VAGMEDLDQGIASELSQLKTLPHRGGFHDDE